MANLRQEWDGLIKIIFNRKNKTLHSCFVTKSVLKILEENYKTYCSLNDEVWRLPFCAEGARAS